MMQCKESTYCHKILDGPVGVIETGSQSSLHLLTRETHLRHVVDRFLESSAGQERAHVAEGWGGGGGG